MLGGGGASVPSMWCKGEGISILPEAAGLAGIWGWGGGHNQPLLVVISIFSPLLNWCQPGHCIHVHTILESDLLVLAAMMMVMEF